MEEENILVFKDEHGESIDFEIIEQTKLFGYNYLLVCPIIEEDNNEYDTALILKDISTSKDEQAVYKIVDNDEELKNLSSIFKELSDEFKFY